QAKPQIEILGINETLIKGAHILEHTLARYDPRRANEIPLQEATLQLRFRNDVPRSFDPLSRDCAVCDLEGQYRWVQHASLAIDVLKVRKCKAGLRMSIESGDRGGEFIGPDQIVC